MKWIFFSYNITNAFHLFYFLKPGGIAGGAGGMGVGGAGGMGVGGGELRSIDIIVSDFITAYCSTFMKK